MSRILGLKTEVDSLCRKAGIEPGSVTFIAITPESVSFTVLAEPTRGGSARTEAVVVTFPYRYADDESEG